MTACDAQFADHPMNPYHEIDTTAAAEHQRRAEQVADRHFRRQSPEFVEWLSDGRYGWDFLAQMIVYTASPEAHRQQIARGMADTVKDDWRCYVCNYPDTLENEIRSEP